MSYTYIIYYSYIIYIYIYLISLSYRLVLLPAVHKIWPAVMNRIKDMKTILLAAAHASPAGSSRQSNGSSSSNKNSSLLALEEASYVGSTTAIRIPSRGTVAALSVSSRASSAPTERERERQQDEGAGSSQPHWESRLEMSRRAMHALPHLLVRTRVLCLFLSLTFCVYYRTL